VWPSIRCNASTFTPALTASDAQVWLFSGGAKISLQQPSNMT
jgi:hypothetical protein